MNIQDAYMACKDVDFIRHAQDKYSKWEQGAPITLQDYMDLALTKYKTLKMKGLWWEAPSPKQEQIIALTATFLSLKVKANKSKKNQAKAKPTNQKKTGDRKVKGPRSNYLVPQRWLRKAPPTDLSS
jgi:hypothetical protein